MRIRQIILGYLGSVLATIFAVTLIEGLRSPASYDTMKTIVAVLLTLTIPLTIVQFTISIIIAERNSIQHLAYYVFTGILTGLVAVLILGSGKIWVREFVTAGAIGGFFSGPTYWLIAGRHAGAKLTQRDSA
jgi:hypothetical protein